MNSNRITSWVRFSEKVQAHLKKCEQLSTGVGHYARGSIQPLDFFEQHFNAKETHTKDVCRYMTRYPTEGNELDILKAADYLSRLWNLYHKE